MMALQSLCVISIIWRLYASRTPFVYKTKQVWRSRHHTTYNSQHSVLISSSYASVAIIFCCTTHTFFLYIFLCTSFYFVHKTISHFINLCIIFLIVCFNFNFFYTITWNVNIFKVLSAFFGGNRVKYCWNITKKISYTKLLAFAQKWSLKKVF